MRSNATSTTSTLRLAAGLTGLVGSTPGDYQVTEQLHRALCDAQRVLRGQGHDLAQLARENMAQQYAHMRIVLS